MDKWFFKNLGDAILAEESLGLVEELLQASYMVLPADLAVFVRDESERRLHYEVKANFSPAAVALAREFNARPCARPLPEGLSLLAGSKKSWSKLFPEHCC